MDNKKEVTLLIVEDNPGHARLIEKNIRRSNITNKIIKISDGQQALGYLNSKGEYRGQTPASPLLILLDLNLPEVDGYQVLESLKRSKKNKHIPVIILTTTNDAREVSRCYELGCNVYITKPVDYKQFSEAVQKLGLLLTICTIPDGD